MNMELEREETINRIHECIKRVEGSVDITMMKVTKREREWQSYIRSINKKEKLESVKKGFSDIGNGINTMVSGEHLTDKDIAFALLRVTIGAGQILSLAACPLVLPLFSFASTAIGYLMQREIDTGMVARKIVEDALAKYEDRKFREEMSGVFNQLRTDMEYMQGSVGDTSKMIDHAVEFLGKIEGKIGILKIDSTNKEGDMLGSAEKVLTYINMYCFTAYYRLNILHQLQFQLKSTEKENKGLQIVIDGQLKRIKSIFDCLTKPTETDVVVLSVFFPSKYPHLSLIMDLLNLDFQKLVYVQSLHYMKNDAGCYAQAGSARYVYSCLQDKLEKRKDKTKFYFTPIPPFEDNLFFINSPMFKWEFFMKHETMVSRDIPFVKFEKGLTPINGENKGAIFKIIKLQNGKFLLSTLPSLNYFMNGPKDALNSEALHFSRGIENRGSLWEFTEFLDFD